MRTHGNTFLDFGSILGMTLLLGSGTVAWASDAAGSDNDIWEAKRLAALLIERFDKDGDRILNKEEKEEVARLAVLRNIAVEADGRITEAALVKAYQKRLPRIEGEARLNLHYKEVGAWRGCLIVPALTKKFERPPVLVFFHGGGWSAGGKRKLSVAATGAVLKHVREMGLAAVSVDYRLVRLDHQEAATCAIASWIAKTRCGSSKRTPTPWDWT